MFYRVVTKFFHWCQFINNFFHDILKIIPTVLDIVLTNFPTFLGQYLIKVILLVLSPIPLISWFNFGFKKWHANYALSCNSYKKQFRHWANWGCDLF